MFPKRLSKALSIVAASLFLCTPSLATQGSMQKESQRFQNPTDLWRRAAFGQKRVASPEPDQNKLGELKRFHQPLGNWGGPLCPSATQLRNLVDVFLATPNPNFPGLGSSIPGTSVSWSSPYCGTLTYAAGLQNLENNKRLTPATLMGIASMTKPIIAAITLKLNEEGAFGPDGLDTPINQLLTTHQMIALTVGEEPLNPRCPGITFLGNRETLNFDFTSFECPDLSRITLRNLMLSNHGMYDFLNEVLLPDGNWQYDQSVFFELYELLGFDPVPPGNSKKGLDYMKAYGLKATNTGAIGGNSVRDFEISFGNTGFQLLGIILENRTGKSLEDLVQTLIVAPLGIDPILPYVDPNTKANPIADNYDIYTGEPLIEQTGVYPLVNLNGHTALNTRSLGLGVPGNINLAGGAASLIANPKSYRVFLDALVNGRLLDSKAQKEFDESFVLIPDLSNTVVSVSNGFGIIKLELRGFPGLGSVDIYQHTGRLPGILCQDAVVRAPGSRQVFATGVICQNSLVNSYPDQFDLLLQFINKFVEARN